MTAEKLNQSGQPVDLSKYPIGTKVFFYRPPSKQEVDSKGRRAKHIDHYVGPARVTKHIGTRSVQLEMEEPNERNITYKREECYCSNDPRLAIQTPPYNKDELHLEHEFMSEIQWSASQAKLENISLSRMNHSQRRGIALKYPESKETGWRSIITPRSHRHLRTTQLQQTIKDSKAQGCYFSEDMGSQKQRRFTNHHTPSSDRDRVERLWRGRIPTEHLNDHILVRDIGLNARGKLDHVTREIAAGLNLPHNCGA